MLFYIYYHYLSQNLTIFFLGNTDNIKNTLIVSDDNVFDTAATFNFSNVYSYESLNESSLTTNYPESIYNYEFETLPCFLADSKVLTDKGLAQFLADHAKANG